VSDRQTGLAVCLKTGEGGGAGKKWMMGIKYKGRQQWTWRCQARNKKWTERLKKWSQSDGCCRCVGKQAK
jgi:hypothetical protein